MSGFSVDGGLKGPARTSGLSLGGGFAYAPVSGPYHAGAVHFDGATWLINSALACTDNGLFSSSLWFNFDNGVSGQFPTLWVTDPVTTYKNFLTTSAFTDNVSFMNLVLNGFEADRFNAQDNTTSYVPPPAWHNIILSVNTNFAHGSKKFKVYVDDVDVTALWDITDPGVSFQAPFNGLPFYVGGDSFVGDGMLGGMADVWLAPGVSLLDGSNDIPVATRRLFISALGKPVNPTGFPAGAVLLSGNASTFATNQGSGGSFTTTGTLTNASSSPSD